MGVAIIRYLATYIMSDNGEIEREDEEEEREEDEEGEKQANYNNIFSTTSVSLQYIYIVDR